MTATPSPETAGRVLVVTAGTTFGIPLHYVVLRPDERTVLARATARGQGGSETGDPR